MIFVWPYVIMAAAQVAQEYMKNKANSRPQAPQPGQPDQGMSMQMPEPAASSAMVPTGQDRSPQTEFEKRMDAADRDPQSFTMSVSDTLGPPQQQQMPTQQPSAEQAQGGAGMGVADWARLGATLGGTAAEAARGQAPPAPSAQIRNLNLDPGSPVSGQFQVQPGGRMTIQDILRRLR